MFDKVGNIEFLEKQLKSLESKTSTNSTGYWSILSSNCEKMSADQLNFINSNDKVIECKAKMMEAFNLFLFERYKEDFAQVETIRPICDEYVNTILQVADDYGDVMKRTLEENEKLKAKIQELERKNAKQNTTRA
jgi:hypothetical protein